MCTALQYSSQHFTTKCIGRDTRMSKSFWILLHQEMMSVSVVPKTSSHITVTNVQTFSY